MTLWLAAIILALACAVAGVLVRARSLRERPASASRGPSVPEDAVTGEPRPIPPRWPRRVDLDPDLLDDAARAAIIESLTVLDDPWAMGILAQAYEEERDPALRLRVLEELREAASPEARPTLERASRSSEPAERCVAYEALAALSALEAVERGLDDPCLAVAQSACMSLMQHGGRDRVAIYLRQADAERAAGLRVVLDALDLR